MARSSRRSGRQKSSRAHTSMVALPSWSPSAALSTTRGISRRRPNEPSCLATVVDLPDCAIRISTRVTFPRRASSTTVNGVFWPRKRGGADRDCTPGTVWRQPRYDTEATTARSSISKKSTQTFARDRWGTGRMIPCRATTNGEAIAP